MMLKEKCLELKLLEPNSFDTDISYIVRCISSGYIITTRICRYIGIGNLHSITPKLSDKGIDFTSNNGPAYCYFSKTIPLDHVIVIYMTKDQQATHRAKKEKPAQ